VSQIICARCGEPWDSTGGLHFTHSDLVEADYDRLLAGSGCLCCRENIAGGSEEYAFIKEWQHSIERMSEGVTKYMYVTFDVQPTRVPLEALMHPEIF